MRFLLKCDLYIFSHKHMFISRIWLGTDDGCDLCELNYLF